jgi:hypothetical protein
MNKTRPAPAAAKLGMKCGKTLQPQATAESLAGVRKFQSKDAAATADTQREVSIKGRRRRCQG